MGKVIRFNTRKRKRLSKQEAKKLVKGLKNLFSPEELEQYKKELKDEG